MDTTQLDMLNVSRQREGDERNDEPKGKHYKIHKKILSFYYHMVFQNMYAKIFFLIFPVSFIWPNSHNNIVFCFSLLMYFPAYCKFSLFSV